MYKLILLTIRLTSDPVSCIRAQTKSGPDLRKSTVVIQISRSHLPIRL